MHCLVGQFALHSHRSLLLPIFSCKEYCKKIYHFTETTNKSTKTYSIQKLPMKFKSAFRAAEAKWRDQISLTAGNETEVPIYSASRN